MVKAKGEKKVEKKNKIVLFDDIIIFSFCQ